MLLPVLPWLGKGPALLFVWSKGLITALSDELPGLTTGGTARGSHAQALGEDCLFQLWPLPLTCEMEVIVVPSEDWRED